MTRSEYLTKIASLLQDISAEERKDAMKFYNDYFDEAGDDNADQAIADLGSPEEVAAKIRESLGATKTIEELNQEIPSYPAAPVSLVPENNAVNAGYVPAATSAPAKKGLPGWAWALIISGVALLIGFIIFIYSISRLAVKTGKYIENTIVSNFDAEDGTYNFGVLDVKKLSFDIDACELYIKPSDDNTFSLHFEDIEDTGEIKTEIEGSTLMIKYRDNIKHSNITPEFVLFVPWDYHFDTVSVDLGAGNFEVDELICTKSIDVDLGAGSFIVNNIDADDVTVSVGAGNVELSGNIAGDFNADLGCGNVTLKVSSKENEHNYKVSCAMGEITIGDKEFPAFSSDKTINNNANSTYSINCALGNIEIYFK